MKLFQTIFVTLLLFIVKDVCGATSTGTSTTESTTSEATTSEATTSEATTSEATTSEATTTEVITTTVATTTTTKSVAEICSESELCFYEIFNFDHKWCGEQLVRCNQSSTGEGPTNPATGELCLDMVTPLRIQPTCNENDTLSECTQRGGMCFDGHCCSKLKRRKFDQFIIPDEPFRTNITCSPYLPLPFIFSFAWCNPADGKVWTAGKLDPLSVKLRSNLVVCESNLDCEEEFVCINMIQRKRLCYFDPSGEWPLDYFAATGAFFPLLVVLIALGTLFVYAHKHL